MKRAHDGNHANSVSKKKKKNPLVKETRRTIQQCCATNNLQKALQVYEKALDDNVGIESQTYSNLLSLCDGLGERRIHVGTPKSNVCHNDVMSQSLSIQQRRRHAFEIKQQMHQAQIPLNENGYTCLIRLLIKNDEIPEAHALLQEAQAKIQPKLRLYSSLLLAYCKKENLENSIKIWKLVYQKGFELTEREWIALMQCSTKVGNAQIMLNLIKQLQETVQVPSKESTRAIVSWFESPHAKKAISNDCLEEEPPHDKHNHDLSTTIKSITNVEGWTISHACRITNDGILLSGCCKHAPLQPVNLSQNAWQLILKMNETIVLEGMLETNASPYLGGGKGKKKKQQGFSKQARQAEWKKFVNYCACQQNNNTKIWDVVLDGANIGYLQQNFADAPKHVDYRQIDWVVQHFLSLQKRVLLVLHQRHFQKPLLPDWAFPIAKKWTSLLYKTPPGCNDDWFWLHAALQSGPNTLVVTNDEMRDHYFQMLSPMYFQKWKDRHQVRFGFGSWMGDKRQVELEYPLRYSRRVQSINNNTCLVVPLPKRGDENRFLDGMHMASEKESEEERYLCICPRTRSSSDSDE